MLVSAGSSCICVASNKPKPSNWVVTSKPHCLRSSMVKMIFGYFHIFLPYLYFSVVYSCQLKKPQKANLQSKVNIPIAFMGILGNILF